jgi:hypothetical protein
VGVVGVVGFVVAEREGAAAAEAAGFGFGYEIAAKLLSKKKVKIKTEKKRKKYKNIQMVVGGGLSTAVSPVPGLQHLLRKKKIEYE